MFYLLFEKHPHYEIHTIFKFVIIQMDRKKESCISIKIEALGDVILTKYETLKA